MAQCSLTAVTITRAAVIGNASANVSSTSVPLIVSIRPPLCPVSDWRRVNGYQRPATSPMSALASFFEHLFATGEARLTGRPELGDRRDLAGVLRQVFDEYRLDVAGPLIEFDAE